MTRAIITAVKTINASASPHRSNRPGVRSMVPQIDTSKSQRPGAGLTVG